MTTMCAGMDVLLEIPLSSDQRGWVALAIAMICIGFVMFRKKVKRDPLNKPAFGSLSQERSVERQMQNLLVELSEMTRRMSAQIDTRAAKLESLIKEADERIAMLKRIDGESLKDEPLRTTVESSPIEPITPRIDPPSFEP